MFYKASDISSEVQELYKIGITTGYYMGFQALKEHYTIKMGCTTYLMGSPYSGKTELWFEFLINLSEFHGLKHIIFSPETGSKEEIIAELCSKYLKKPFYKNYPGVMSESELYLAMAFVSEYFIIIDSNEAISIDGFFEMVDEIEAKHGRFDTTTIDPFNEIAHNFNSDSGRQDLYIERVLGDIRRNAKAKNRHNCVITHCADQVPVTKDGVTFYHPPTARQYSGGQAWFRKGLGMIGVWRPPVGLLDASGIAYEENETHIIIQKAKPKGIGKTGTVKLFFDWKKNRFYEKDEFVGAKYSAPQLTLKEQSAMTPNVEEVITPNKDTDEPEPF